MDVQTAAYPWELFHDYKYDVIPTFVRAGLIRQLYTEESRPRLNTIFTDTALVIADPIYTDQGYAPLPFAAEEGKLVSKVLKAHKIETTTLINKSGLEIINDLYNKEYRILHIAGHGTVDDNPNETGVVLDNEMYITPSMLANFSRIPEFVFINCCYSGTIDPSKEAIYQKRYQFAANIGTELIRIGARAVVVAGWPVNDAAAGLFAHTLYSDLLDGDNFGDAVRHAREALLYTFR
ncbi:MAG: CHAT domain-containing protein [Saprospiraceae bacterium]|nr:CHAT domain-containing protein [Saprospiraceae bacterium]